MLECCRLRHSALLLLAVFASQVASIAKFQLQKRELTSGPQEASTAARFPLSPESHNITNGVIGTPAGLAMLSIGYDGVHGHSALREGASEAEDLNEAMIAQKRALLSPRKGPTKSSTIRVVLGGTGNCQQKPFPDAGVLYRPEYNKRIRCKMEGGFEFCEECWDKANCWHGEDVGWLESACKDHYRKGWVGDGSTDRSAMKIVSSDKMYTRYINRAYVCRGGKEKVTLKAKTIKAHQGDLKFFFDGKLIHQGTQDFNKEWNTLAKGLHEFVMEFTSKGKDSSASVGEMFFEFNSDDRSCKEDEPHSPCFALLQKDPALANSNEMQLQCFTMIGYDTEEPVDGTWDDIMEGICYEWRDCLQKSGKLRAMKALVMAGQIQPWEDEGTFLLHGKGNHHLHHQAYGKHHGIHEHRNPGCTHLPDSLGDDASCYDPRTQMSSDLNCMCAADWEWKCDVRCPGIPLATCMTYLACMETKVCASWKKCACPIAPASDCEKKLHASFLDEEDISTKAALSHRANHIGANRSSVGTASTLEQTFDNKCSSR